MQTTLLIFATVYGVLSVILGAFAAHLLKKKFTVDQLESFQTGVKYQIYHAITLLIIGLEIPITSGLLTTVAWCFIAGTFLFSFSIYGLCISSAIGKKLRFLGPITPLGGLLLIIGWCCLLIHFIGV